MGDFSVLAVRIKELRTSMKMTQKELLYFEDAVGHEGNIIKIIEAGLQNLEDENLREFMNNELNKHNEAKQRLMNVLEAKQNE